MKYSCKIVNMIYNFLSLNKIRKIEEASRIIYSKAMPHPSRTMQSHDLVYVVNGGFFINQENEKFIAEKGDIFFLTGNRYHFSNENSPKNTECIFLHFNMDSDDHIVNEHPNYPIESYVCIPNKLSVYDNPKIKQLFDKILILYYQNNVIANKLCSSALFQLLIEIEAIFFSSEGTLGDETVDKILEYLNLNQSKNVTVEELSEKLSFSSRTLHTKFKNSLGITIHQYQLNSKLSSAALLLRDYPSMTLKEISSHFGFTDEFHFSKCFKNKYGKSPQAYRKNP